MRYKVGKYSQFWYAIIDTKVDLYVKGNVGPYKLDLYKTKAEAEKRCEELNELNK